MRNTTAVAPHDRDTSQPAAVIPLHAFLARVGDVLRQNLPDRLWIRASVLAIKQTRSGHQVQFGEEDARLDAFLPGGTWRAIASDAGALDPATLVGMTVLVEIAPQFDPRWHLQARVLDLDRATTRSLAAVRLERLRATLKIERLYDRQRAMPGPADVTRVALIHPAGAASLADVETEIRRWEAAGLLAVSRIQARFEGDRATADLVAALTRAATEPVQGHRPDVILLVRGGGSRASLAVLDSEILARAICRCPIPVLVGLGHASDLCFVDEVAWAAAHTPSKAVAQLGGLMRAPAERTEAALRAIARASAARLEAEQHGLRAIFARALTGARLAREAQDQRLAQQWTAMRAIIAQVGAQFAREADAQAQMMTRIADHPLRALGEAARAAHAAMTAMGTTVRTAIAAVDDGATQWATVAMRAVGVIDAQSAIIARLRENAPNAAGQRLDAAAIDLDKQLHAVDRHDVSAVLALGYALPIDHRGRLVRSRDAARAARSIDLLLHDGMVAAVVVDPSSCATSSRNRL
jgi:exodeoxyribonuclease VII large subunit